MKRSKKQIILHAKNYVSALENGKLDGSLSDADYRNLKKDLIEGLEEEGISKTQIDIIKKTKPKKRKFKKK